MKIMTFFLWEKVTIEKWLFHTEVKTSLNHGVKRNLNIENGSTAFPGTVFVYICKRQGDNSNTLRSNIIRLLGCNLQQLPFKMSMVSPQTYTWERNPNWQFSCNISL